MQRDWKIGLRNCFASLQTQGYNQTVTNWSLKSYGIIIRTRGYSQMVNNWSLKSYGIIILTNSFIEIRPKNVNRFMSTKPQMFVTCR